LDKLKPTANKRLYASWSFSNGPSALVFQMNFSNLALTNRVFSGQASSRNTDYPTSVKPRPLWASVTHHTYGHQISHFDTLKKYFLKIL